MDYQALTEEQQATELVPTYDDDTDHSERSDHNKSQMDAAATGDVHAVMYICLLQLFTVIIFFQTPWVIGQTGIRNAITMLFLFLIIQSLTTVSMSIICKAAGSILSGGPYFMISRACGPIVGGAVGSLYCIARIIAASWYSIKFAETLVSLTGDIITGHVVNDVRVWSCIIFIIIATIIFVVDTRKGLKPIIIILIILFYLVIFGLLFVIIGSFYKTIHNNDNTLVVTPKGWSNGNLENNFKSGYVNHDWGQVFMTFFPVFGSLTAGADISGDLVRPAKSIPRGTLGAIGISVAVYMFVILFIGAVVVRDELINNVMIMFDICVWDKLLYMAVFASLSGHIIISLLTASRLFQAIAKDKIFPCIFKSETVCCNKFGYDTIGYLVAICIGLVLCVITEIDRLAVFTLELFLLTNVFINIACVSIIRFDIVKKHKKIYVDPIVCVIVGGVGVVVNLVMMFAVSLIDAGVLFAVFVVMILVMVFVYYVWGKEDWDWNTKMLAFIERQ